MHSPKNRSYKMPRSPAYAYHDPEKGPSSPAAARFARVKAYAVRRPKIVLAAIVFGGALYFLYASGLPDRPPPAGHGEGSEHGPHGHGGHSGHRPEWPIDDGDEAYDEEAGGQHQHGHGHGHGHGLGSWSPLKGGQGDKGDKKPSASWPEGDQGGLGAVDATQYVVDSHGDHFLPHWDQGTAPMHPDVSLLPDPSDLFPEIDLASATVPPVVDEFPDDRLRDIISPPELSTEEPEVAQRPLSSFPDSFANTWKAPGEWDGPKAALKKVQWEGFRGGRDRWETEEQSKVREERKEAVKRGFKHAWEAYKRHAWGHDEVKPASATPSDPFNGWGATIVDSLDTLLIMGFSDEYNLCRPHVNQLNFAWVGGRDWNQSYVSEDYGLTGTVYAVGRDRGVALGVFETGIRYLGGLLGAYDLSGDRLLLDRAEELAGVLGKAFHSVSGLPAGRIDPGAPEGETVHLMTVSIAEVGSMSLELIRLSQITRDRRWFDLAQRAMDYIDQRVVPRSTQTPLIPLWIQPDGEVTTPQHGQFAFGGLADSYYEYLIKTYKLLGGTEVAQTWRRVYEASIDRAKQVLYQDITVVPGHDLLTIGKFDNGHLIHEMEHLTCFAGAMLGLGAKLLDRPADMQDALRVTGTCYWLSADTPTGLQPEVAQWYEPHEHDYMYANVTLDGLPYHPRLQGDEADQPIEGTHWDAAGGLRWNGDNLPVEYASDQGHGSTPVEYAQKLRGTPTGTKRVNGRGINRPETIESIFYMYRLTGDRKWQEKGWKMFVSWMQASKVDGGISGLNDVTSEHPQHNDNMESFALAETFKYHYLLQSEPDVLSLDDYVLNTEAHPLLVNPKLDPTSSASHVRFWTPSSAYDDQMGVTGQGTHVQKHMRDQILNRIRGPQRHDPTRPQDGHGSGSGSGQQQEQQDGPPREVAHGGGGMGGGGGRPGDRPQPPPGFGMDVKKVKVGADTGEIRHPPEGGAPGLEFPEDF
ncbi:hypothetical protein IAU60_002522 [Kwoniella sp. DSM 27419]